METSILFKWEILIFFLSLGYIIYYIAHRINTIYLGIKKLFVSENWRQSFKEKEEKQEELQETWWIEEWSEKVEEVKKAPLKVIKDEKKQTIKERNLTQEEREKLSEITKKVKINSSKSYLEKAKSLIIEGLAIDKYDKDLNLELATIYEKEKNYKNAEYIYEDLKYMYKNDKNILKRLGYVLALQRRFAESVEVYEKALWKTKTDMEIIDILIDIYYEIGNYDKSFEYLILFLKENPRNVQRMILKAELLRKKDRLDEAKEMYRKVLELQPYNTEARENMRNLS